MGKHLTMVYYIHWRLVGKAFEDFLSLNCPLRLCSYYTLHWVRFTLYRIALERADTKTIPEKRASQAARRLSWTVGRYRSCAVFDEMCGTNCSSSVLLTFRPGSFHVVTKSYPDFIRWDDQTWVWSNNGLWKLSTTYTVLTIRLTNVSICFKAVIHKPYRTFSLKFQAYTEFIVHMLLGSLGLTRGPGNNVIPEGLAIDEIPYIINVPVASSDPQFDLCTLTWHHVFDDAVYPCDFTGWNEACQMTVFCCLAKRLCFIPSAFIVLRKNELVDVIITLENCWEKSNFLFLIVFSNKLYIFWFPFSNHVSV